MGKEKKASLIDHINKNNLSEEEKKYLIALLENNDYDNFIIQFIKLCKLSIDLIKLFNADTSGSE